MHSLIEHLRFFISFFRKARVSARTLDWTCVLGLPFILALFATIHKYTYTYSIFQNKKPKIFLHIFGF